MVFLRVFPPFLLDADDPWHLRPGPTQRFTESPDTVGSEVGPTEEALADGAMGMERIMGNPRSK